jgi:hypothetical protein
MPFQFTCPYCFKKTLVDESLAGEKGPCVGCGKVITIPEPPRNQPAAARPIGSTYVAPEKVKTGAKYALWALRFAVLLAGIVTLSIFAVYGFWPTVKGLKVRHDAIACMNNLQRIAKALNGYAVAHGTYPTPIVVDATGTPLYSWRVLILPYLDEAHLYANFKLNEAWDSESNSNLIARCPEVFITPNSNGTSDANYALITGAGTIFPASGPLGPAQITDDHAATLLVVEVKNEVTAWSAPFDINVAQLNRRIGARGPNAIGGNHVNGAAAVSVDERPLWLSNDLPPTILNAIISPTGNESIAIDEDLFKLK